MTPAERIAALELEADRTKERLDNLDRYLQGDADAWLNIIERLPDHVAEITVDKALAEARQQALALATITKTLAGLSAEMPAAVSVDPADELKRKRAERLAAARAQ